MTGNDYYADLMNPMRMNTASAGSDELKRIERIEKGRAQENVKAFECSPVFTELKTQTQLAITTINQQEKQIKELQAQNAKLEAQLDLLKKSDKESSRQAKRSLIGFAISTAIALASLIVAVIALVMQFVSHAH